MINKEIWGEILSRASKSQSSGGELYLDDLLGTFTYNQIDHNVDYLVDHGLIEKDLSSLDDSFGYAKLTSKGYDYLESSGGLTKQINEKFNTITIKVDEEQFRALLLERISQSSLPESEKKTITSAIKDLPSEMVTVLATKLLETGLESLMDVLPSIGIG